MGIELNHLFSNNQLKIQISLRPLADEMKKRQQKQIRIRCFLLTRDREGERMLDMRKQIARRDWKKWMQMTDKRAREKQFETKSTVGY